MNEEIGTAIAVQTEQALAVQPVQPSAAMMILKMAADPTVDIERIKALMDIALKLDAIDAKKQYDAAIAQFKLNDIVIVKDKDNLKYKSKYSTLGNAVTTVNPFLAKCGLNARWSIDQESKPGQVVITCILTHAAGHFETCKMFAPPDESGGPTGMNAIQRIKSTRTYLENTTFESILGLAPSDKSGDDDGNGFSNGELAVQCREIETAETLEDCTKLYLAYFAQAKAANNGAAKLAIIASKEKRKKELTAAQPKDEVPAATPTQAQKATTTAPTQPAGPAPDYLFEDGVMEGTCTKAQYFPARKGADGTPKKEVIALTMAVPAGDKDAVYCYHAHLFPALLTVAKGAHVILTVTEVKGFRTLEDVRSIDSIRYRDGKKLSDMPIDDRDIPEGLGDPNPGNAPIVPIAGVDDVLGGQPIVA
jgi:hypothetical protein